MKSSAQCAGTERLRTVIVQFVEPLGGAASTAVDDALNAIVELLAAPWDARAARLLEHLLHLLLQQPLDQRLVLAATLATGLLARGARSCTSISRIHADRRLNSIVTYE